MIAEILQPMSVPYSFQGNVSYPFMRVIKRHFILNDNLHQSIIRDTSGRFLMATALNNLDQAGKQTPQSSFLSYFCISYKLSTFKEYRSLDSWLCTFFLERCISPQLKPPAKAGASTKPRSLTSRCPVLKSTKCSVQLPNVVSPLVLSVLSSFLKMRKLRLKNVK